MILADYHVHTNLSHDGISTMEGHISYAIKKGIKEICFTEHYDVYEGVSDSKLKPLNVRLYSNIFNIYKEMYKDKISLKFGIEIGLQPDMKNIVEFLTRFYHFDFVIGSSHITCKKDISKDETFFENLNQRQANMKYFNEVLQNIQIFDEFDVYGHLDYIVRYGNYDKKYISYLEYQDILDKILITLIDKNKGIEVNTSGYKYGLNVPHPNLEILARYKKLGGSIITIGSDAHENKYLCSNFDRVRDILLSLGYKYYTTFDNRKPHFVRL